MFLKSRLDWLPSFHPYEDLQQMLSHLVGGSVHPLVPWALSFLNGAVVLGMLFGRIYRLLPGRSGAAKGLVFGVFGWLVMGVLFFPMLIEVFLTGWVLCAPCPFTLDAADLQHHHGHFILRFV
jgi:hypothetical protein